MGEWADNVHRSSRQRTACSLFRGDHLLVFCICSAVEKGRQFGILMLANFALLSFLHACPRRIAAAKQRLVAEIFVPNLTFSHKSETTNCCRGVLSIPTFEVGSSI